MLGNTNERFYENTRENKLLTDIESSLINLHNQSTSMNSEITNHTRIIEMTTSDVDDSHTNLEIVDKKIETVLGSNKNTCMIATIILLLCLVILFGFLLIYL